MRLAWLDCSAGAAGDMLLAALLDAGAPREALFAVREALGLTDDISIGFAEVPVGAARALRLELAVRDGAPARQVPAALALVAASALPAPVRDAATRTIRRLADVESRIHGLPVERLHLHELSAADTLLDIVGFHALAAALGLDAIEASPPNVGGGTVTFSHGTFAVPPPATAALLQGVAFLTDAPEMGELLTPTAAAIIVTSTRAIGPRPRMAVERVGSAVGTRRFAAPHVLRCHVGTAAG
ncbi:MAG: pyridinium-3,5-bisthiocarboxylic acid mononucleotide nickel chelatase [Chloroflexota bacterium]|nr:pyridinium-3,5-bisthiocarboxylic acid mononucleotide nickel chelatase [Chloroflexota bacterium]